MADNDFSIRCHNCSGEVNGWLQCIEYVLSPTCANQAGQTLNLSCGCVVDFPEWQIDLNTGECKIIDFYGKLFLEFLDEEMINEEED